MKFNNLQNFEKDFEDFKIILEDWIPKEASIAVAVNDQYVYFSPSFHHNDFKTGMNVHPDSIAAKVLATRKKTEALIDESIFNIPYYGIGYPITVNNQPGALVVILPSTYIPKGHETINFLTGKQNEVISPIPVREISYLESLQKRTWFYANNEQFKTNITLKELQTKLPNYFVRIHRSYIINIYFIKKISKDLTSNYFVQLKDGKELPISSSYINDLRNLLDF